MSDVIDIRKRLEDRAIVRETLTGDGLMIPPPAARAFFAMVVAFATYVELDGRELVGLFERALAAPSINEGAASTVAELKENLGEPFEERGAVSKDLPDHGPTGELGWTDNITFFGRSKLQEMRALFGSDWEHLPDSLKNADEWAAWHCLDEAGGRWSMMGDARVVRAALATFDERPGRQTARVNWWVDGIPHEAFTILVPGWVGWGDD